MALFRNYKIETLRELANDIGRDGVAKEALKAVEDFDGTYKGAMELAGKLTVIADMDAADTVTVTATVTGMAGDTADIVGNTAFLVTSFSGGLFA